MKQVLQSLKTGTIEVAEVPAPAVRPGTLLIRTQLSLISQGTERMLIEFGKAGWIQKVRQQPEKVNQVLNKIRTDGLLPTLESVRNKLDQPLPLGYCNVGRVLEVGPGVTGFEVGERVVSNGGHAEVVSVPVNLCAKVPGPVSDEEAVFAVLGAVALQGIRLAQPTLGECVVVTGLGLVGLLAVQLLRAHGCRVLGLDFDGTKVALAKRFGAEAFDLSTGIDPVAAAQNFSRGRGVDAVIVTASTRSSAPIHQAAAMCRKRGRIILVGVTGLKLSRGDFYEKELSFQVSCSYGPGRYDPSYEQKGCDYPVGFVRWTVKRNFEAVLDMLAEKRIDVLPLISHRFPIAEARQAYEIVSGGRPSLGILLTYSQDETIVGWGARTVTLAHQVTRARIARPSVSFIGAGNYAGAMLIPAFKAAGARLRQIVSANGVSSVYLGRKFGFEKASTDVVSVIADSATHIIVICTRHDTHADYVVQALAAGKHVFVEKPLALTLGDLERIARAALDTPHQLLMVGFNRRFAPHVQKMKSLLDLIRAPKAFVMTVNAGAIPPGHWTQDPQIGGGRILGEACHFIDLLRFLAGAPITRYTGCRMASRTEDTASIQLCFQDGSIGTIHYLANGSRSFPKERLEVFAGGGVLQLDNFRKLKGYGWPGFRSMVAWRQDKGQRACVAAFLEAVKKGMISPIPLEELLEVSRVTIEIADALR